MKREGIMVVLGLLTTLAVMILTSIHAMNKSRQIRESNLKNKVEVLDERYSVRFVVMKQPDGVYIITDTTTDTKYVGFHTGSSSIPLTEVRKETE